MSERDIFEFDWLSRKGKGLLKQHGRKWEVIRSEVSVAFSRLAGPWLLVRPIVDDQQQAEQATRWVHATHDDHLKIRGDET